MSVTVKITDQAFDPFAVLADAHAVVNRKSFGACASFIGMVRDHETSPPITSLALEHYPGMAEREITKVCQNAAQRWSVGHIEVWHRVGRLQLMDSIVVVGVWAAHRAEAFDACRAVISYLKDNAPIWKHEESDHESRWVDKNTRDPYVT